MCLCARTEVIKITKAKACFQKDKRRWHLRLVFSFLGELSIDITELIVISTADQAEARPCPLPHKELLRPGSVHGDGHQVFPVPWPYIMQSIRGQGGRGCGDSGVGEGEFRVSLLLLGSPVLPSKPLFYLHHVLVASESNPSAQLRSGTDR